MILNPLWAVAIVRVCVVSVVQDCLHIGASMEETHLGDEPQAVCDLVPGVFYPPPLPPSVWGQEFRWVIK